MYLGTHTDNPIIAAFLRVNGPSITEEEQAFLTSRFRDYVVANPPKVHNVKLLIESFFLYECQHASKLDRRYTLICHVCYIRARTELIGQQMKTARLNANVSIHDMASFLHVPLQVLVHYEDGLLEPPLTILDLFAACLGISTSCLTDYKLLRNAPQVWLDVETDDYDATTAMLEELQNG